MAKWRTLYIVEEDGSITLDFCRGKSGEEEAIYMWTFLHTEEQWRAAENPELGHYCVEYDDEED